LSFFFGKKLLVDPSFLKEVLPDPFRTSEAQEDASEFGIIILEKIQEKSKGDFQEFIKNLFEIQLLDTVTCKDCDVVSKTEAAVYEISLSFCHGSL